MQRGHRSWRQRFVIAGGTLSALVFAASAAGISYVQRKVERLPRVELSQTLRPSDGASEPRNVLIVGVDSAEELQPGDPVRFGRDGEVLFADVIMILRVDPEANRADLVSVPRDLWVSYPGSRDQARINRALDRAGGTPDLLIDTLDDYLGIPVHHYVQLDFAGFRQLIDAVGGVPLHFNYPTRDRRTGLNIVEPGCVTLDDEQALAYARSRSHQVLVDGEWETDPTGDLGRIERQQVFIRATIGRALSLGVRNPGTLDRILDAALASVTVDDELTTRDIVELARRFRSFDPDDLSTYQLPVRPDTVGSAQIVRLIEAEAEPILALFRGASDPVNDVPPGDLEHADGNDDSPSSEADLGFAGDAEDASETVDDDPVSAPRPESIRLGVLNGSGETGQATEAASDLAEAGFGIASRGNAENFGQARSQVRYPRGSRAMAELVERWLVAGAQLAESADEEIVVVVTGADWEGVRDSPRPKGDGSESPDEADDRVSPTTTTTSPTPVATPC